MIHYDAIHKFLEKWESRELEGYIPCKFRNYRGRGPYTLEVYGSVIGQSGVTIGTGLDLGQQGQAELRKMRMPEVLVEKFKPYLLLRKEQAVKKLESQALHITDAECDELDTIVHKHYISLARKKFDREAVLCCQSDFEDRPAQVQTVAVSLVYHYGPGSRTYKDVWTKLVMCDYDGAVYLLNNNFNRYQLRRKDEAKVLKEIL